VLPGAEKDRFQSQEIKFQEITVPAFTRNNNDLSQTPAERALRLKQSWADLTPEEGIELRPEPRLPRKQVLALKLTLSEKMKNYLWLEKLLRQEKLFQPPLAMRIRNEQEAESAAGELRRHWDLGTGSVVNLLTFLEERGLKTFKLDGPEKFESLSGFYRGQPFIAVEKSLPVDRIRFRTAAELAQVMFGLVNEPEIIRLYNRFAAAFLLPAKILEEYFLPAGRKIAFSELAELKLRYGISLQAIMRRALDLELVTERRFRSFREMMNEKGWLWKEPVEYPGEENPTRFRRLLHYAVSSEILDLNRAAGLAEITPEQLKKEMGEIF
jgi:Zn-dependent peptidase ImmA (M78 family)